MGVQAKYDSDAAMQTEENQTITVSSDFLLGF